MESALHQGLKAAALEWLFAAAGCSAAAAEVSCPLSRRRVDAAGYLDALPARRRDASLPKGLRGPSAGTIIIECKVSRGDYRGDAAHAEALLAQRRRAEEHLRQIESQYVRTLEPHLRRSDGRLFAEMETWDFERSASERYRAEVRRVRRLERAIHGSTKFFMMARYRLAGRLYLLAPAGLLSESEIPTGWGLLERPGDGPVTVRREAPPLDVRPERVQRLLRNIAVAASAPQRRAACPPDAGPLTPPGPPAVA
ncbi:MAG: hypothetical protein JNJ48_02705 [Phycisphaerae bacterium]|nr:hypothetical protein [Phycisphaerae bacterium]